jgi:DNA-directed RNA polymerase subunit RPC12/RpoP
MQKRCRKCGRIIIEDFEKYLEENKEQAWLQCPYCFYMERIR